MKGECILSDPRSHALLQDIAHVMECQDVTSLPLRIIENWPSASTLDNLIASGILEVCGKSVKLNVGAYQEIIWRKTTERIELTFPPELFNCLGPPWNSEKRILIKCKPKLEDIVYSCTIHKEFGHIVSKYLHRSVFGQATENIHIKPLDNVTVVPAIHEGDYLQYIKVKRALNNYNPDFVGVEGLGPIGTRYLVSSLFTLRSFTGLPYCVVMKPYINMEERIEFYSRHPNGIDAVKACLTAESDFAVVVASCIGKSIPFFPVGVPEEIVKYHFPHYFEIEKRAWLEHCKNLENEAKQKAMGDLNALCDFAKIEDMENIVLDGRISTFSGYKKQLIWSENYMASRIYDFYNLCKSTSLDPKIVVFVGLCHSRTVRDKIMHGSWRYIPPINELVTPVSYGLAQSKIAGYLQLYDGTSENFVSRFERTFSPSPMHAELFEMKEPDVIGFVKSNLDKVFVTTNEEEVTKMGLVASLRAYHKTRPRKYDELTKIAERYFRDNGSQNPDCDWT